MAAARVVMGLLGLCCGAGSPALSYILVQPPTLPDGRLIIFTSYTPFFPLHHSSWNSRYLEKEFNFMQQIPHSPANSVKASFCSRTVRRIFRWPEVLAAEILVVWETQQCVKALSVAMDDLWLGCSLAATARPLIQQQRMHREQKSYTVFKRLCDSCRVSCSFDSSVVMATPSGQHNSSWATL